MKTKLWAIFGVIFCTAFTSIAQILFKKGSQTLEYNFISIITNYNILIALFLYGIGAGILIISLKGGDLSLLYPIIASSYIWVCILSIIIFHEEVKLLEWIGIFTIIAGIIVLTIGDKNNETAETYIGA